MRQARAFTAWFGDPATPARARDQAAEAARATAAIPALAAFRRDVAAAPAGSEGMAAIEAAVAALFADTGWCATLIGLLCERLAADPFFAPPQRGIDNGLHSALLLHDDVRVTLALGLGSVDALAQRKTADRGPRALILSGRRGRLRFLRGGGATIAFHALDGEDRLRLADRRHVADGDGFAIDGTRATWIIEHAARDMVLLQATLKDGGGPYSREFDPATGLEIARSTTDEAASRTQLLVSLLGAMQRTDAAPAIGACLDHPAPFVRWHAMRELVTLDGHAALPQLLGLAAADPEREVRDAARATLALLRADAPCPA